MTIFLVIAIVGQYVEAQGDYLQTKIIPPSPTAAALGAYGDIPIGYYTGTPNISIPLFEINTGSYSLPISLSYNASSVRVAEDASWVGLGWSLNAGGVITRSIRGLDDLNSYKGYYYLPALPLNDVENYYGGNWNHIIDFERYATDLSYRQYVETNLESFDPTDSNFFMEVNLGLVDAEPDIYYYNFAGYTGSFVMGKLADGSPIIMPEKNNLKFEYIPVGSVSLGKWKVTAPDGTIFYFNTTELTEGYVSHTDLPESDLKGLTKFQNTYNDLSVSSWYLDKIEPVKGSGIEFNYASNSKSLGLVNRQQTRYDRIPTSDNDPALLNYFDLSRQVIYHQNLSSIEFENGKITFLTGTRNDIQGLWSTNLPQKLESIQVYNKKNQLLKAFELGHDYFNSVATNGINTYASLRLKLNSVTEYGKSGYPFYKSDPYIFTYYNPNGLPTKYSRKVDSWGYYNPGIPDVYIENETYPTQLPAVNTSGRSFVGVDRKADETGKYSRSGMLETITYPTKGSTKFIYEPNRRAISPPDSYTVNNTIGYAFSDDQGEKQLTDPFTLSSTTTVKFHLYTLATYGSPIPETQILGYIKNSSNQILGSFTTSSPDATLSLASGSYYVEVDLGNLNDGDYDVQLYAYTESTEYRDYEIVGGNRIKEIKNYDTDGQEVAYKKFIYTENGYESGAATGFGGGFTKQHETRGVYFHEDDPFTSGQQFPSFWGDYLYVPYSTTSELYLVRKSNPIYTLGLGGQSGSIGYKNVYVLEGGDGSGGLTKYSYYSSSISSPINPFYFYIPGLPIYRDPIIGKLKSVEFLNSDRQFLKREEYVYQEVESERDIVKGLKIFSDRGSYPGLHLHQDYESIKFYDNVSKWYVLGSKIVTEDLGGDNIVTVQNYDYENPDHFQLTKTGILDSKGDNIESKTIYPSDIPDKFSLQGGTLTDLEFGAVQDLISQNRIVPIQTESYKNSVLLSRQRTLYKDWGSGLVLPKEVQTSKGTGTLKTQVVFHKYDGYGNLQEISKVNGPHTVYIWGYNGQYPIAKIENVASYGSISSSLIDAVVTASNSDYSESSENSLRTALENLRNSLPDAMVTTYTYDPLVGVTSICDSKGVKSSYAYDNFNRLRFVKDETNKLLQENRYHYKN
ncbi:MAG: YD repeat protein [Flavobacteriaceae bacterium FS1-H7996/R]|nr:MAG: YD repeat protein [Flavobacteriaceae bacterium FS1-H7996/R]